VRDVAIYRLEIKSIGRSAGRKATAAAAYRSGERIRDERSGELFNYSRRKDVLHTEIFLPSQLDATQAAWARDRAKLWNTAEGAEKQRNSRVAREYQVALPPELTAEQRLALARAFSREIADRHNVAVDLAVHDPKPGGDPRNFHAHLLATTREVTPEGLGAKAGAEMGERQRHQRGLPSSRQEFIAIRERWATLTNEALREANVEARVDHRSLNAQGIDREPRPTLPIAAYQMESRGVRSEVAERLREDYRARVQARLDRAAERARIDTRSEQNASQLDGQTTDPKNVAEIRRQAREAWLRLRPREVERSTANTRGNARDEERKDLGEDRAPTGPQREDDFAL
jgi:ATP-dependent exoDNAse (exonuclease V) alpha subunit